MCVGCARYFRLKVVLAGGLVLAGCADPGPGAPEVDNPVAAPASVSHALGAPVNGYPSYMEMLEVVAINRGRADPNNIAAGTMDPCSTPVPAVPPVVYDVDLGQAARFHCANSLLNSSGLSHDSYCTLQSNIEATLCDGSAGCACVPGSECFSCMTLGGCGTDPATRVSYFGFPGFFQGENGAAGYSDSWDATGGYLTEDLCTEPTEGHRFGLTDPAHNVVGTGYDASGGCWPTLYFSDYGFDPSVSLPVLPSGIHRPETGAPATVFDFYANYYDPGGAPASISVVIDGTCFAMSLEIGTATNAAYLFQSSLSGGCHQYYFLTYDSGGVRSTYPTIGSYQVSVGGGAPCAGGYYVPTQMIASCDLIPCNDGICDSGAGEDCGTCPGDCGACVCGDGVCEGETCATCAADCGICPPVCGDGLCDGAQGEDDITCPADCGCTFSGCDTQAPAGCWCDAICVGNGDCCDDTCAVCGYCSVCGDGLCDPTEDCAGCSADCGSCCGNGVCEAGLGRPAIPAPRTAAAAAATVSVSRLSAKPATPAPPTAASAAATVSVSRLSAKPATPAPPTAASVAATASVSRASAKPATPVPRIAASAAATEPVNRPSAKV